MKLSRSNLLTGVRTPGKFLYMETTTATAKLYKGKQILSRTVYADGTAHLELWGAHPELGSIRTYENGAQTTFVRVQIEG